MSKKIISMMLVMSSLAFVGCGKDNMLTEDKVILSSDKNISEDGNYVVVVELGEGIENVDYTLTENGQLISSREDTDEGLKENIISNKANGEYKYVVTVEDDNGNVVSKDLVVTVDSGVATSTNVSNSTLDDWSGNGVKYLKNDNVKYNGKEYSCLQDHTSQDDWNPISAVSLWKEIK